MTFELSTNDTKLLNYIEELLRTGDLESIIKLRDGFGWTPNYLGRVLTQTLLYKDEEEASEPSPVEVPEEPKPTALTTSSKQLEHTYTFKRNHRGGTVVSDITGMTVASLNEYIVRSLYLEHGDKVTLNEDYHIIDRSPRDVEDPWVEAPFCILEKSPLDGRLRVSRLSDGRYLTDLGTTHSFYYPSPQFLADGNIKEGALLTLVWKDSNPSEIFIRDFVNEFEEISDTTKESTPSSKTTSTKKEPYTPTTDLDLTGLSVALIVGDSARSANLSSFIQDMGGSPVLIDGFDPKEVSRKLPGCDLALLTLNYTNHATSGTVRKLTNDGNIPLAVSDSLGLVSIERALWRAVNGKPSRESDYIGPYFVEEG